MTNATITQIREGLAANLSTINGFQVSAYPLANPTPPAIQILRGEIEYDLAAARGLDLVTMQVQAIVALTADIGSQMRLDPLIDPTGSGSVKAAIESDRTLGGTVAGLRVTGAAGDQIAQGANGPVLVCQWTIDVYASN
jgi:hypothetical protein